MREGDIRIGRLYKCANGWFRRPLAMTRQDGYLAVYYESGRRPDRLSKQYMPSSLRWFASTVLEEVSE